MNNQCTTFISALMHKANNIIVTTQRIRV